MNIKKIIREEIGLEWIEDVPTNPFINKKIEHLILLDKELTIKQAEKVLSLLNYDGSRPLYPMISTVKRISKNGRGYLRTHNEFVQFSESMPTESIKRLMSDGDILVHRVSDLF